MADYYKSRYLADPTIYVQGDNSYCAVQSNGDRTSVAGRIPDRILGSLEPMAADDAERLIATAYSQVERVEVSPFHHVYSYTSPAALVTQACLDAINRLGWKARFEGHSWIADEDIPWWKTGWTGYPRTLKLTIRESDGQTILDIDSFANTMTHTRRAVGHIIERLADLIDQILKGGGTALTR
jgi:hypothetical protein